MGVPGDLGQHVFGLCNFYAHHLAGINKLLDFEICLSIAG